MLDMSGNVYEWTRSLRGEKYPYILEKRREDLMAPDDIARTIRGGAFRFTSRNVRCASRDGYSPDYRYGFIGFRLVVSPMLLSNSEL
jgi:formylglycine-generating enzyme required for sulfatase activity